MIYKLLAFFGIVFISFSGYSQSDSLYFSVSSYRINGEFYKKDTIAIKNTKQHLDVCFYKDHFYIFYGLPKKLIRKEYKNQKIVEWSKKDHPKDDIGNWSESYTYDAQGRLIEYEYSSCDVCSQLPWGYKLMYDNNIIEQNTYYLSFSNRCEEEISFKSTEELKDNTKLTYDSEGYIILLESYDRQGISKKIQFLY